MIDRNSLKRARSLAKKYETGGTTPPVSITEKTKQQFAKANNLSYSNGQFFDSSGNPATVDDSSIQAFVAEKAANREANQAAILGGVSEGINMLGNMLVASSPKVQNQSGLTQSLNTGYDMAANVVSKVNPLAGTIMKAGGFAADALTAAGIGTDQQTTTDKILDSKFMKLTPVGLVNAIGASKTQDFSADQSTIEKVGGSYGGTVSDINEAVDKAGKSYGLFSGGSKKKANNFINEMRRRQNIMADIAQETTEQHALVDAMGDSASNAYGYQLQGGFDQRFYRAKQGMKVPERSKFEPVLIEEVPGSIEKIIPGQFGDGGILGQVINPTTGKIEEWQPELLEEFKQGGKVEKQLDAPEIEETDQKNVIPEGALHKNKHHMENADDLTKKGIPVVDGDHKQQAEIECNEIIFTKEVTTKLEELYKTYYSEESSNKEKEAAALDAGKLLTKEIMLNTDDRTGLIDTLQSGGTINQKKPPYKEWLTGVNPNYISDNYDLETAYNVLPFEQLERWKNETNKDKPSDSDEWHLPSVQQIDDNTIMFLKKGKTTKDNPELKGEFEFYTTNPEFSKEWKMKFNKDENRWYYIKRKPTEKSE